MNHIRNTQARIHATLVSRDRRGVSMLEYVLIAAVGITLAGLFVPALRTTFTSLFDKVGSFVGSSSGSASGTTVK
jgi:Flp pilus assembly pilin Flp